MFNKNLLVYQPLLISLLLFSNTKSTPTTDFDNEDQNAVKGVVEPEETSAGNSSSNKSQKVLRDLVVLTDMQPDDRIALAMIGGNRELSKRLLFVGTTLLNTERKKALAKRQLRQMGMDRVEVYAGTGAHPSNYQLNVNVETAKAAFEYLDEEGRGILPEQEWEMYKEVTDQNASADENVFYQQMHMDAMMADPENINRSFLIVNLPESTKPTMMGRQKEDRETVVKLLDMLGIGFPPKFVYRLPKTRGMLDTSPRRLKVVFTIHLAISIIFGLWRDHLVAIRKEFGPNVDFIFSLKIDKFTMAKNNLLDQIEKDEFSDSNEFLKNVNKKEEENERREDIKDMETKNDKENKEEKSDEFHDTTEQFGSPENNDNEEDEQFYDAYDHEEVKIRRKEKKKKQKKQKKNVPKQIEKSEKEENIEENLKIDDKIPKNAKEATWMKVEETKANKKKMEEVKIEENDANKKEEMNKAKMLEEQMVKGANKKKMDDDDANKKEKDKVKLLEEKMVKGLTLKEFKNFFVYNEEVNTIIIKGLPDVDHQEHKASKRHEADFKAACELLYALGMELPPLAVLRTTIYGKGVRRPPLKVFLRNKQLAKMAVDIWDEYSKSITRAYKKPEWEYVFIHANRIIKAQNPNVDKAVVKKLVNAINEVDDNVPSTTRSAYLANKKKHQENIKNPLRIALKTALLNATKENPLEILLMTAPTDLVQVLVRNPQLRDRIGRVHLMCGWTELGPTLDRNRQVIKKGPPTIWSNYNLAMAPESAKRLFQMDIPIRLYTYRDVREVFNGSVNEGKFGDIIKLIEQSESQVMKDFLKAAKSWDQHVLKTMPYLHAAISKYAGRQFSPSDPILVVGLTSPEFMQTTRVRKIKLEFAHEELHSMGDVLEVQIEYDVAESNIELVTFINKDVFSEIFHYELQKALRKYSPRVQIEEIHALPRYQIVQNEGVISVKKEFPCRRCNEYGHLVNDCPIEKKNIVCYKCGISGHIARNCPITNRP